MLSILFCYKSSVIFLIIIKPATNNLFTQKRTSRMPRNADALSKLG